MEPLEATGIGNWTQRMHWHCHVLQEEFEDEISVLTHRKLCLSWGTVERSVTLKIGTVKQREIGAIGPGIYLQQKERVCLELWSKFGRKNCGQKIINMGVKKMKHRRMCTKQGPSPPTLERVVYEGRYPRSKPANPGEGCLSWQVPKGNDGAWQNLGPLRPRALVSSRNATL